MSGGPSTWPRVKLDEALHHVARPLTVDVEGSYREIGIRSHGKGLFHKAPVTGAAIGDKRVFYVEPGDFVLNIVFAWEGAVGIASEAERGMIASHRFPCFRAAEGRVDLRYVERFFHTPAGLELLGRVSPGGAGRNRTLNRTSFMQQEIPLPPLPEQERIVARIDDAARQLDDAQSLQAAVLAEADEICRSILRDAPTVATPLREVVRLRAPDVDVLADSSYRFAGVYSFGRGVFAGNTKSGTEFSYPKLTRLRTGDFVYPKLMAWEGAFGVVPRECDGLVVSTEFPVFEVTRERVLPEVLDVHFRNPAVWASIGGASTGTNVRRRRLNPQDFLDLELPLPSMERQRMLAKAHEQVQAVKARQSESRAMMQALLPAILDRAFAGAL